MYYLLIVITVLLMLSNGLAYGGGDDNGDRFNEITNKNFSKSDFSDDDELNDAKIGLFIFTQYCGPGERVWKSIPKQGNLLSTNTYANIDVCCKQHDECPNYISIDSDYDRYPGLPRRQQIFSRLECSCDAQFFSCLNALNSQYASTVAFGYGVVQSQCFNFNYPIVGCNNYSNGLLPPRRCLEYRVDNTKEKIWQWFDVPPASSKLYDFPRTTTV